MTEQEYLEVFKQQEEFHDNLISFGEEFKVERSKTIAAMVKEEIDMK